MLNLLTVSCGLKRPVGECSNDDSGEFSGGLEKKMKRFRSPVKEDKIKTLSNRRFALQSRKKIRWAVNMYNDWRRKCLLEPYPAEQIKNANLNSLFSFSQGDLEYALARFIREVRKVDMSEYPPNTLREIIIMIQMYLHENNVNWKLLDGNNFSVLRNVLDNTMKERTSQGLGVRISSDIILLADETKMFNKNILGDESPIQLLETLIYMLGLHLALRGGSEHGRL